MDDSLARALVGVVAFNGFAMLALAWVLHRGINVKEVKLMENFLCDCHEDEELSDLDNLADEDEHYLGDPDAWKGGRHHE